MKTEDEGGAGDLKDGVEFFGEAFTGVTVDGENGGVIGFNAIFCNAIFFLEGVDFDADVVAGLGDTILRVTDCGIIIFSAGFGVIGNCEVLSSSTLGEMSLKEVSLTTLRVPSLLKCEVMYCLGVMFGCFFICIANSTKSTRKNVGEGQRAHWWNIFFSM